MSKNSAKVLAEMVLNPRSEEFQTFARVADNGVIPTSRKIIWSSGQPRLRRIKPCEAALRLRDAVVRELKDLLSGNNWDAICEKIAQHSIAANATIHLVPVGGRPLGTTKIRVGTRDAYLVKKTPPTQTTAEQMLYHCFAQVLQTGDIRHLMVCKVCGKLFYRKNPKGRFCTDKCRWAHFNTPEKRHARYRRSIKKVWPNASVSRRPQKTGTPRVEKESRSADDLRRELEELKKDFARRAAK